MRTFVVERQEFTFPEDWQVLKFDDAPHHKQLLGDAPAVDLVVLPPGQDLLLIEVKDFRGYGVESRRRLTSGALYEEIGRKVRATVAGLIGGCRCGHAGYRSFVEALVHPAWSVRVIAWLEHDYDERDRGYGAIHSGAEILKRHVRWLDARAIITSTQLPRPAFREIRVRNLPREAGS